MVINVYDDALLMSMFKVMCQDNAEGLGLGVGFWKPVDAGYLYVYT